MTNDKHLQLRKVLQDLETLRLALLRMKLRRKQVAAGNRRAERMPAFGLNRHEERVFRHDVVRVHEIKERPVRDSFQHRRTNLDRAPVPSHMRHLQRRRKIEPHYLAAKDAEPLELAPLITHIEQ